MVSVGFIGMTFTAWIMFERSLVRISPGDAVRYQPQSHNMRNTKISPRIASHVIDGPNNHQWYLDNNTDILVLAITHGTVATPGGDALCLHPQHGLGWFLVRLLTKSY